MQYQIGQWINSYTQSYEMGSVAAFLGKLPIWLELLVVQVHCWLNLQWLFTQLMAHELEKRMQSGMNEWGGDELYWNAQKVEQPRRPSPMMQHK